MGTYHKFDCRDCLVSETAIMGGVTVRDVDAQKFIVAYADFLKRQGKLQIQVGLILSRPHTPTNFLLNLLTGSTFELPLLPDMSTSENPSAWAASEKSTAAQRTVVQDPRTTLMRPAPLIEKLCNPSKIVSFIFLLFFHFFFPLVLSH